MRKMTPKSNVLIFGSQEQEQKAEEERIRMENILSGNPLLNLTGPAQPQANFKVKRRYCAVCAVIPILLRPLVTQSLKMSSLPVMKMASEPNVITASGFHFLPQMLSQALWCRIGILMHVAMALCFSLRRWSCYFVLRKRGKERLRMVVVWHCSW